MTRALFPALFAAFGLAASGSAVAQDAKEKDKETATRQKATAVANLKKVELKGVVVETDYFLVAGTISEEKAKALGKALDKVVPVARKAAQYEEKDEPWKGKLAVYFLPEGKEFKSFVRGVVGEQPSGVAYSLRSDDPFVVDPVDLPGKVTDADQFANTAAVVAGAYLKAKTSGSSLPDWLRDGFGRVTAARAEGTSSKRYQTYKTQAKAAVLGKGNPPALADLWGGNKLDNADVLTASFAEYLAYGPGAKMFPQFLIGLRPDEAGNNPAVTTALEAAGWKDVAMLEAAWRKWVQTGK